MSGAEVADGVEECRKAVRRQVGAGADWIKVCVMGLLSVFFSFLIPESLTTPRTDPSHLQWLHTSSSPQTSNN